MSDFSLITNNRIAQFAARFEAQADGSFIYYHPDRATGGLRCTQAEFEQLLQEFAQTQAKSLRRMMIWAIASGVVMGILEASETLILQRWMQYAVILAPLPLVFYSWRQASLKPLKLFDSRLPCSPPRTAESAFWKRVEALPASLFIAVLLPCGGLVYYTIQAWPHWNMTYLLIIASNLLMIVIWLYARYIRKI